jgi:undecaprenyl-diphosphatase
MVKDLMVLASSWWFRGVVFCVPALLRDRRGGLALRVLIAYGLASAIANLLKVIFHTARPPASGALVALPHSYSFPSGHAATAFAAATVLAVLVPRWWMWTLPVAALVAWSRLYLGVHHPIDVVGGAVVGIAVGVAVAAAPSKIRALRALKPPWRARSSSSSSS